MTPKDKTTTTVVPVSEGGFMVLADAEAANLIAEVAPTPSDLQKLTVPAGSGGAFFTIEGLDGDRAEKTLEVIVAWKGPTERSFYATPIGEGDSGPPHCSSRDGKVGYGLRDVDEILGGTMGPEDGSEQECATCQWAQFGSALGGGKAQACSQRVRMIVFDREGIMPMVVQIPAASLKALRKYEIKLLSARKRVGAVVTRLSLAKQSGSPDYFSIEMDYVRDLEPGELERLASFAGSIAEAVA